MMHRLRFSFVLILFGCIGVAGVGSPASVHADSVRFGLSVDSGYQPTSLVRRGHHRFTRHKNHPLRVIPRIGFRRHVLPIGHVRIVIGGASFYVHGGVFLPAGSIRICGREGPLWVGNHNVAGRIYGRSSWFWNLFCL